MIIGIVMFGRGKPNSASYIGFVATKDDMMYQYYSYPYIFDTSNKADVLMQACKDAIEAYKSCNNGKIPNRVIVYREGVAESMDREIMATEVKPIGDAIGHPNGVEYTYLIVNKRISVKLFLPKGPTYDNPPMGTIVDSGISRKDGYDFYMVPLTGKAD